jgi:Protein of unknown function (DUF4013)
VATAPTPGETTYVDFGRAFQFYFEDPEWVKKTVIGALFYLLAVFLVGLPFVAGYIVQVTRRTARGEALPLPEWTDYGQLFSDGLQMIGLYLLHFLAAMLLPGAMGCLFAVLGGVASGNDAAGGVMALGMMASYLLLFVILLVVLVYFPAAYIRTAITGRFGAGLEVRENIELIKRSPGNYFLAIAIYWVTSFIAQFGIILCFIGILPAAFWSMCVTGWAFGEVARRDPVLGGRSGYATVFA